MKKSFILRKPSHTFEINNYYKMMMLWFLSGEALIFAFLKQPHQNGALSSKLSEVHFKRRLDVMTLLKGVSTTHSTKNLPL
jgi:hypothetical protein